MGGNAMQSERNFDHAVRLAAAFIANGDIRLDGSVREDSQRMQQLADLIDTLCNVLADVRQRQALPDDGG